MIRKRETRSMTPQALSEREGVDIVDVREPDEWRAGHITNLDGGLAAWARGGLPLATADGGPGRVV